MKLNHWMLLLTACVLLIFYSSSSMAELAYIDPVTSKPILDQVVDEFLLHVKNWQTVIQAAATRLFWTLVLISMVWTFGMMILQKADIGDFFAEFTRFIIFTGFFFWLLTNAVSGQNIAGTLMDSMYILGNNASGLPNGTNYTAIMDVGYGVWSQTTSGLSPMSPIDSFVSIILGLIILLVLTVIAVNMLLLLIAGWVLMFAGVFFLGFGGSRWTSDIAINYFKTVFGLGIQLFTMILIVGIGSSLLTKFHNAMSNNALNYEELGVMTVVSVVLLILSSKLPAMLAGVITGSSIGSVGMGSVGAGGIFSAGAAVGGSVAAGAGMLADKIGEQISATRELNETMGGRPYGIEAASRITKPEGYKPPSGDLPPLMPDVKGTVRLRPEDNPRR